MTPRRLVDGYKDFDESFPSTYRIEWCT